MKPVFLDTETTGTMAGRDRLCSVCFKHEGTLVHELFKPPVPITVDAMAVHHITNRMVENKEAFEASETKEQIASLLKENVLVAHNAAFDIGVLAAEGIEVTRYICTLRVAQHLDEEGKIPRFSLQYLRYLLDLNIENAPAHDARGDVLVLEALFARLMEKSIKIAGGEDAALEHMVTLSQQPVLLKTMKFGKYKGMRFAEIVQKDSSYLNWLLGARQEDARRGTADPFHDDLVYTLQHHLDKKN